MTAATAPAPRRRARKTAPAAPQAELLTVDGSVVRVHYASDQTGYRVLRVDTKGRSTIMVGVMPAFQPGDRFRARGAWVTDPKYGEQFKASTVEPLVPTTTEGLARYLGHGFIAGLGPTLAKRIVEKFGAATMDVLDKDPGRIAEVRGISADKAQRVAAAWGDKRQVGRIMAFLQQHGASPSLANRIHACYGDRAVSVVESTPYRLALDVDGVGFATADTIAQSIGIATHSPERAQAGVLHVLSEQANAGHVWTEEADVARRGVELLAVDDVGVIYQAMRALESEGRLVTEALGEDGTAVFVGGLHRAEVSLARGIARLLHSDPTRPKDAPQKAPAALAQDAIATFEREKGVELAPAQRQAVHWAAERKVLVVTGGPGTGKSTILRSLIGLFQSMKLRIQLASPTGRAAKRMAETTGIEASTIHRLLDWRPGVGFTRDEDNPIQADVVVIDESSMCDLAIADRLVRAISSGARLVLVGDVDQLPSVGPGSVLRDIIDSGRVPTVRLNQIFRQAEGSLITENAHRINAGQQPAHDDRPRGQFIIVPATTPVEAADRILEWVTDKIPRLYGFDPIADVRVLCPMRKTEAGVNAVNARIQATLNPNGQSLSKVSGAPRVGDVVRQMKNDYERGVFNGDLGWVTDLDVEEQTLTVNIDGRPITYYEPKHLDQLVVAYATSIHAAQGSEVPAVVIPVLTAHFIMLTRNLLYTAVTRGKSLVVLVGDPKAIGIALRETRRGLRRTQLASRLVEMA